MSKYRFWSDEQLEILLSEYGTMPTSELAKKLHKPIGSVYHILKKENVDLQTSFWTAKEVACLEKLYASTSNTELRKILNRSEDAIQFKAASLNLTKDRFWTTIEIEELKKAKSANLSHKIMSELLNRSQSSIHNKLIELGLTKNIRRWTDEEIVIIEHMTAMTNKFTYVDIAQAVKATYEQVQAFCVYRGLNTGVKRTKSKGEEQLVNLLQETWSEITIWTEFHVGDLLRVDIFLPEKNLAIEYDGIQHFEEIDYFQDNLADRQYRDDRKEQLCADLGIHLIRFAYNETLTQELFLSRYNSVGDGPGNESLTEVKKLGGVKSEARIQQMQYKAAQLDLAKIARQEQYQYLKALKEKFKNDS